MQQARKVAVPDHRLVSGHSRRIRVCMLSFYFTPEYSGSAVQARNLSRHLTSKGVDAFIVSARLSKIAWRDEVDGIPVFRIPVLKHKSTVLPTFWLSLAIFLILKRQDYDVIHAHGTVLHAIASVVGRLLGKKTILKVAMANSDIAFQRQGRLMGRINQYLVRRFDHYIATSKDIYQEFQAHGIVAPSVTLLPNGVDTSIYHAPASELEKQQLRAALQMPDGFVVCYVGILIERKNIDLILRVWKEVKEKGVRGHLFLVGPIPKDNVGDETLYCRQLRQYVVDNGLVDSVTFTGYQEAVSNYLRASDVFLFPSKQEGMPNVLLEAMASGLPCVVSRISGTEDLVQNDQNGFILPLKEEDEFTNMIFQLARNPALMTRIGRSARDFITSSFSLQKTAERYLQIYLQLLGKK